MGVIAVWEILYLVIMIPKNPKNSNLTMVSEITTNILHNKSYHLESSLFFTISTIVQRADNSTKNYKDLCKIFYMLVKSVMERYVISLSWQALELPSAGRKLEKTHRCGFYNSRPAEDNSKACQDRRICNTLIHIVIHWHFQ